MARETLIERAPSHSMWTISIMIHLTNVFALKWTCIIAESKTAYIRPWVVLLLCKIEKRLQERIVLLRRSFCFNLIYQSIYSSVERSNLQLHWNIKLNNEKMQRKNMNMKSFSREYWIFLDRKPNACLSIFQITTNATKMFNEKLYAFIINVLW